MTDIVYELRIDFDGDGTYSSDEDVTADILDDAGVSTERGMDLTEQIAEPQAGTLDVELDNASGDYSVGGAKEPKQGQYIRLRATDPATSSVWPLWTGIIQSVEQHADVARPTVALSCEDAYTLFANAPAVATELLEDETIDVLLGALCDAVGWPAGARSFDVGQTTLKQWWLDDTMNIVDQVKALQNSEGPGARIFVDPSGNLVFKNRYARVLEAAATVVQTTFHEDETAPFHSEPFKYDRGRDKVVNFARFTVKRRSTKTESVVWALGTTLSLAAGETYTVTVRPTSGDPFKNLVVPVAGTDYNVTSGSVSSMSLNRTSGGQATLTIVAGSDGLELDDTLQVRGQLVSVDGLVTRETTNDTSASQAAFGLQLWNFNEHPVRAEIDPDVAQDWCNAVPGWWEDGRPVADPVTVYADASPEATTACLSRAVGDRVALYATDSGLSAEEFWIDRIAHHVADGMHVTTFAMEQATAPRYFVLDDSDLDGADVLGW